MKCLKRKRPDQLESVIAQKLQMSILMQDPTGGTYAGKGSRPMPQWSFSDFRERQQRLTRKMENALTFAFLNERLSPETPFEIPASAETMWCLARPGDDVLLSDRVTHHYTEVGSIDHTAGFIEFIDPWPNQCFLLENQNEAGIAAQIEGTSIIISKVEFLRVITGLQTIDSPDFIDEFVDLEPANIGNPALHFALGSSLLFNGNDAYVRNAVRPLRFALDLAQEQHNQKLAESAAQKLHLALSLIFYLERTLAGNDLALLNDLEMRYAEKDRVSLSTAEDCYRLGLAAGKGLDFEKSVAAFSCALEKDPEYEDAYTYRALSRQRLGQLADGLEDTSQAIQANERNTKEIQRRFEFPENQSAFREAELMDEFAHSVEKRATIFQLRAQIERDVGDSANSMNDALESARLHEQVASLRAAPQKK